MGLFRPGGPTLHDSKETIFLASNYPPDCHLKYLGSQGPGCFLNKWFIPFAGNHFWAFFIPKDVPNLEWTSGDRIG